MPTFPLQGGSGRRGEGRPSARRRRPTRDSREKKRWHGELEALLGHIAQVRGRPLYFLMDPGIDQKTALCVAEDLGDHTFESLDVVLIGPGGDIDSAYVVARLLRSHAARTNALIPYRAKSALTLIALACNSVDFSQLGELGPLDVQYMSREADDRGRVHQEHRAALNIFAGVESVQKQQIEAFKQWVGLFGNEAGPTLETRVEWATNWVASVTRPLVEKINVEELGKLSRDNQVADDYLKMVLPRAESEDREMEERQTQLREMLTSGFSSHSFVLDRIVLEELGHPVNEAGVEVEKLLLEGGYDLLYEGYWKHRYQTGLFYPDGTRGSHAHAQFEED